MNRYSLSLEFLSGGLDLRFTPPNIQIPINVTPGVVDTPNRLIIMTTNHPEKLDPALIRPGRINKKVCLGFLIKMGYGCRGMHALHVTVMHQQSIWLLAEVHGALRGLRAGTQARATCI